MPTTADNATLTSPMFKVLGASVLVHVALVLTFGLMYTPPPEAPPRSKVESSVRMESQGRPQPINEPPPEPKPEPEPDPAPEPEPLPKLDELPPPPKGPPPPPPQECRGCAKMAIPVSPIKNANATDRVLPVGVPGGVPGGMPGGVPGGVIGGVPGGVLGGQLGVPLKRRSFEAPKPLAAVIARALATPNPDANRLQKTQAARGGRDPGTNKTAFCVDIRGRATAVRTKTKFPGDPEVDEICRDAVKKWRFRPFILDGRPIKVCSVAVFEIAFD